MWNFNFQAPTQVQFGWGSLQKLDSVVGHYQKVLIICGKSSARSSGLLDRVENLLGDRTVVVYDDISPNPRVTEINKAAEAGAAEGVEIVIGLGGGSAMDAAKATAAAIGGAKPIEYYLRDDLPAPEETLPILAIPTTSGTGSETSMGAIVSDEENKEKKGLRGIALLPKFAIVDPELTLTVPQHVTAETGFDIFTHAMETFVSRKASAMTKLYSIKAIETVLDLLPVVVSDLSNKEARTELSFASMLMGYNLMHAGTCLPHRLQYPLGAHTDCSHPGGLAALYPAWCRNTAPHAIDKFDEVARLFESRGYSSKNGTGGGCLGDYMVDFFERVGIATSISQLGLDKELLDRLPDEISGSLAADPGDTSRDGILKIYHESW